MKIFYSFQILILLLTIPVFSQNKNEIEYINNEIKSFFIKKGEITKDEDINIVSFEVLTNKSIGFKNQGIYIIRTVFTSSGHDYLLYKKDRNYEIIGFDDLGAIVNKTYNFFNQQINKKTIKYINKLIVLFNDNKKVQVGRHPKLKIIKKDSRSSN